ncbi:MAG: fasciclin domain-containing protein [Flavobacteriaceae bacterium]|nr:fasciclin domain-containing protein [Flavobacteriaceae bacterium]
MKNTAKLMKLMLWVAIPLTMLSCSDDDSNNMPENNSIAAIASRAPQFTTLVSALEKADLVTTLDGEGSFTVFAPTNTAFSNFLTANGFNSLDDVPVSDLREVLLNHVVLGTNLSSNLTTGYVKTLGKGSASATNTLSMYVNVSSNVMLNGVATVTTPDIVADNGVIHEVNAVIELPTIVTHALANSNFTTLVAALTRNDQPDFVGILSGSASSPFTVFAPTNNAFGDLLAELNATSLDDINQATLENTLKYHVVAGANVLSSDLSNNMTVTTFQGQDFTITTTGGAKITDANDRMSNIEATDVQCSNGVIHVIDKVILPLIN